MKDIIDRLWDKYNTRAGDGVTWEIDIVDKSNFRQAMLKALEKQRGLTLKAINNYFIDDTVPIKPMKEVILNTKLEEQK